MANRRFIDFPIASTVGDTDIILIWQGGANKQTTKATFLNGLPENLDELNDVAISGLTNGQILRYDSVTGKWENTDQGNLDLNDLNDVSIVSPSNGQVLVYNSSTSKWENSSGGFVPYVGAVTTVDLGAQGLRAGYVRFDTTVAGVPNEQGLMFWDADDETVDIILNGYTMKIGEDLFYPVKNQTGSTIAKGVAVRFNGTLGASGRLLIAPFIADGSVQSSRFMGVTAEEILNGEDGKVLYFGRVRGINTNAFNEGDILYASTTVAGGYQTAIPLPPNNIVEVAAVVTKSATVGTIFVRPTLGSNINKDEGVKITSVADKNLLQYQSGTALWENKTLAQVLGGTSAQFVKGDGSLDSTSYGTGTVTSVGLSSATSGVTIGSTPVTTSGTITLAIATASGSQNGLLSSTDWTTFNSKQNALTNPVTGTGSAGQVAYWTGTNSQTGNSNFFWDNSTGRLAVNSSTAYSNLTVSGSDNTDIFTVLSGLNSRLHVGTVTSPNNDVYIRSQNNYNLKLGTNSTNYLTIFNSGNLLIQSGGTTTDNGARLQVSGDATFSSSVTALNNFLVNNPSASKKGYTYQSPASNWGPQLSGLYFTPNNAIDAATTFTVELWNGIGSTITPLSIASTGAATFSSSVTANGISSIGQEQAFTWQRTTGTASDIYSLNADSGSAYLYNNTTARVLMTWIEGGNVGIGTASPVSIGGYTALTLNNATTGGILTFQRNGTNIGSIYNTTSDITLGVNSGNATFETSGAERMRITSSGNVGIGDNNPTSSAGWTPKLVLNATLAALVVKGINGQENTFGTSNGLYIDSLGNSTGTNNNIIFRNSNSNSSFSAETRMVITSSGNIRLFISPAVDTNIEWFNTSNSTVQARIWADGNPRLNAQVGGSGGVYLSSGGTSWTSASDIKLKNINSIIVNAVEKIKTLKAINYSWKSDINNKENLGLIAQEIKEVFPQIVDENNDGYLGVRYTELIPVLVSAIQELKQEIDTLKN